MISKNIIYAVFGVVTVYSVVSLAKYQITGAVHTIFTLALLCLMIAFLWK